MAMRVRRPGSNGRLEGPVNNAGTRSAVPRGVDFAGIGASTHGDSEEYLRSSRRSPGEMRFSGLEPILDSSVPDGELNSTTFHANVGNRGSGADAGIAAASTSTTSRSSNSRSIGSGGSSTRIRGVGVNGGSIGPGGGVVVPASTIPHNRIRTTQTEEGKRPPPAPLTLITGTPLTTRNCGACAETVKARLDEPVLLMDDRHAAGVFSEADEDSDDSDDDSRDESQARATERAAEKAAATAFWQHHHHAAGGAGGWMGTGGGLSGGDGQRHRAIWRPRGPKTSSVGLIICLNIGEAYVHFPGLVLGREILAHCPLRRL